MKPALLILCISFTSFGQQKSDLKEMNLKGKVKSVEENNCMTMLSDGDGSGHDESYEDLRDIITMKFNISGNLTQYGNDYYQNKYIYNSAGKLILNYSIDKNGDTSHCWKYRYDSKKNNTELEMYSASGFEGKNVMKYDAKGNVSEERRFDEKGKLQEINAYKYDINNRKTEETSANSEGRIYRSIVYKYDAAGNNIEYLSERTKILYTYDKNRNMTKMSVSYNPDTDPQETTFTYKYDASNNWIEQTTSENGRKGCTVTRKYEYYK